MSPREIQTQYGRVATLVKLTTPISLPVTEVISQDCPGAWAETVLGTVPCKQDGAGC